MTDYEHVYSSFKGEKVKVWCLINDAQKPSARPDGLVFVTGTGLSVTATGARPAQDRNLGGAAYDSITTFL